jgi:transposase
MEGDKILMSGREARRLQLLGMAIEGKLTLVTVAEKLGLSYRQAKRLKRRLVRDGPRGLVHGNRGRHPPNRLEPELAQQIVRLAQEKYALFNDSHLTEMLAREEGIRVGRETVRCLLRHAGLVPKRKRKVRHHHRRRPRKPQEGLMMLWDGSPHAWFGTEQPPCCLMAAMDDATSRVLALRFVTQESGAGYLWLLNRVVRRYGIPQSVYQDRHGALRRNDDWWSLEEQLAGQRDPTQVGAALETLGIQSIYALTPQAKGRIERLFNTLQDRLIAEMDLKGIRTLPEGNRFLANGFLSRFNRDFAVAPQRRERAYATVPKQLDLSRVISFRYRATVRNDNTVRLGGLIIDIPPGPGRRSYAKAKVEVRQLLDGSWRVYYRDRIIARHAPTSLREPRKIKGPRKKSLKGVRETLWIYLASKT